MIKIKNKEEIQIMREGGKILANILKELIKAVKPGIATEYLDKLARELVFKFGAKPSFLSYRGYPAVLCVSVNEGIVHGVPSERKLEKGDVVKLDMGVLWKGFHTDSAVTVLVGAPLEVASPRSYRLAPLAQARLLTGWSFDKKTTLKKKLIRVTRESLDLGIRQAKVKNTLGDIGFAVQKHVEKNGFNVVRGLVGHGIGRELHEEPQVPNYGQPGTGQKIVEGMVIAIEPMVVAGDWETKKGPDGFVFQTKDGGLAAHFEHTVAVTEKSPLILTQ